jgi:3-hydroxyisobutyrate dehydrogenase
MSMSPTHDHSQREHVGFPGRPRVSDADRVTWLGVGRMGEAMAERLIAAGVEVHAWNRTGSRLDALIDRGGQRLASPMLSKAGIAFSMVLDDDGLDALWQAPDGILRADSPPTVWVDCSTVSPAASMRAASAAAERGTVFVCAPVSGNPSVVRAGNVIFAVSGPSDAVAVAMPFLNLIGRGSWVVGAGHEARVVKLCTNMVLAVLIQALAEALVLGESHGVHRGAMMEFINNSAIGSPFTRYKTAALVELDLRPAFTPEGQRKDLRLALDLGRLNEVPTPVASATDVEFSRLIASQLGQDLDFAALILLVARDAGITLTPEVGTK